MSKRQHLCLTCRHALWGRSESGRLTGNGFCDAPDPALPALPAVKWWMPGVPSMVRGGDISRNPEYPVTACEFYQKDKR